MNASGWDAAAEVVSEISHYLLVLIPGLFLAALLAHFLSRCRSAAVGAAYSASLLVLYWIPWEIESQAAYLSALAVAVLAACLLTWRQERRFAAFLCVTFYALQRIAYAVGNAVASSLNAWAAVLAGTPERQFSMFVASCAGEVAACTALLGWAVFLLSRNWPRRHMQISNREFFVLVLPSFAVIATSLVFSYMRQALDYAVEYLRVEWLGALLNGVLFGVLLAMVVLYARITAAQDQRREQEVLQVQSAVLRQYVEQLDDLYTVLRRYRHDLANHRETIENLAERGEMQAAESYADASRKRLDDILPAVHTGNPVTDVILSSQRQRALEEHVSFHSSFRYPNALCLDPFDIGTILHNAGANAFAGTLGSQHPAIRVRSALRGRTFMIEYENTMEGTLVIDPATGLPMSTKKSSDHGMGLVNIRSAAERLGGTCEISAADGICTLSVLLVAPTQTTSQHEKGL